MNRQLIARRGFTLVEILVAITVIAILGGMLVAGLFPALRAAKEMSSFTELTQVSQQIEAFKTKYGFYPPSFVQFQNLDANERVARMRRYLSRISPNHQESNDRINAWFLANGNLMNPNLGHDIVFWLSGMFKNKQFPLTGGVQINNATHVANILPAYSVPATSGDLREILFEFDADRLVPAGGVAGYSQLDHTPSPMLYIDSASYAIEVTGSTTLITSNWPPSQSSRRRNIGYWRRNSGPNLGLTAEPTVNELLMGTVTFENPNTFQLFYSGTDGVCGQDPGNPSSATCASGFNVRNLEIIDSDNIANFANGRLDNYSNSLTN